MKNLVIILFKLLKNNHSSEFGQDNAYRKVKLFRWVIHLDSTIKTWAILKKLTSISPLFTPPATPRRTGRTTPWSGCAGPAWFRTRWRTCRTWTWRTVWRHGTTRTRNGFASGIAPTKSTTAPSWRGAARRRFRGCFLKLVFKKKRSWK